MDGEDLSKYDNMGEKDQQKNDDNDALDKLDWELASIDGRMTGMNDNFVVCYAFLQT